ncbi:MULTISPECIES: fatty acid desaturase [unclassified Ekhidna]|jgi:fatty-acid desaturase|uniref:fatty acid desaturase n=1 Tax=unclassified Ekhidna TaxID=2632188 RepID=UPI0032DF6865
MTFIDKVLKTPSYGWEDADGALIVPSKKQLFREFFSRINVFKNRKNWISGISWLMVLCMLPFFYFFIFHFFSLGHLAFFMIYAMVIMSTHGTIWFHRFCTHRSYTFTNSFWRFITQNLVIKTFPEEIYVISHHVHHAKSDEPGDPYNAQAGLMYCMMSDVNHQSIADGLTEAEYKKAYNYMRHTGVQLNNYKQYQKWGSVATPWYTITHWLLNWAFWYTAFFLIGGHGLACTAFSAAMFWFVLVRAFNYTGHGKGKESHKDGIDYDRSNLSINQTRPGTFSGEWHNNHHLYPESARAGFLPYQLDLAWVYIYCMFKLGAVATYRDDKKEFLAKYRKQ